MVVTPRQDLAERVRLLRDHGARRRYEHEVLGGSSRLDELQAALLRVKLRHLPGWIQARRRLAERYRALLRGLPLGLPVERPPAEHVYHHFTVRVARRDEVARALGEAGVGTTVHYPRTIPAQPLFALPEADRRFPEAARAAREVLSLPCFPELTEGESARVAEALGRALAGLAGAA
jgi:dTDP-4-amino-4,6-dideoxygalactose transaminase